MELVTVLLRTLMFYFFILVCYRIMGKREIAQLSISDLSISILIAELVAISIENRDDNTILTIMPIILLVFLEVVLTYLQLKFNKLRVFMDGKPSLIIKKGKLNIKQMIKQRYSLDDLLLSLRSNQIKSIDEIDYALLETNGKLSIFKKKIIPGDYPLPLIIDGIIEKETLLNLNKNENWLKNRLADYGMHVKGILYAFYKKGKIYVVRK